MWKLPRRESSRAIPAAWVSASWPWPFLPMDKRSPPAATTSWSSCGIARRNRTNGIPFLDYRMEFAETKVSRQEISGGQTMAQTAAGFEIAGHGVHHALALLGGQFREHRQGQAGESGLLAFRKFTLLVAQAGKALLQVHGQRVIHLAADLVFLQ